MRHSGFHQPSYTRFDPSLLLALPWCTHPLVGCQLCWSPRDCQEDPWGKLGTTGPEQGEACLARGWISVRRVSQHKLPAPRGTGVANVGPRVPSPSLILLSALRVNGQLQRMGKAGTFLCALRPPARANRGGSSRAQELELQLAGQKGGRGGLGPACRLGSALSSPSGSRREGTPMRVPPAPAPWSDSDCPAAAGGCGARRLPSF